MVKYTKQQGLFSLYMNTTKETYTPSPLWVPDYIDEFTAEVASLYDDVVPNYHREGELATTLAEVSQLCYVPVAHPDSPIYRAGKAISQGEGNCMAHTEVVASIGTALGLDMMIRWDDVHATAFFIGSIAIWEIDGYTGKSRDWLEYYSNLPNTTDQFIRELSRDNQGGFIYVPPGEQKATTTKTPKKLGETCYPRATNSDFTLLMPVEQGVEFFGAHGDLKRYEQCDPERYRALSGQIQGYIPQSLTTWDQTEAVR